MVTLDDLISPDEFVELRTNHLISNERIEYLGSHAVLTVLVDNQFNASHVPALIVGDGWKDKLEWIAANYEGILKPMGFKPTHVARIVRGRDWKDKLYWVEKYSGEASYTPLQIHKHKIEATGFIPQINQWVFALRFYNNLISFFQTKFYFLAFL